MIYYFFLFKQKTAYEMRISDWSSDVCSSDLGVVETAGFKVDNTVISMLLHVFLGAENNGAGRTGFDACRFLPDCHPVGTQGALIGLVVFFEIGRASCRERVCQYV